MIVTRAPEAVPDAAADTVADVEAELAAGVIGALLREDYAGLSRHVRSGPDGPVLAVPGLAWPGGPALPLRADGFLGDLTVVRGTALTLRDVECVLGAAPAADAAGVAAFGVECRQALETLRSRCPRTSAATWISCSGWRCGCSSGTGSRWSRTSRTRR